MSESQHLLIRYSLLSAQVCSAGTEDEALAWVRREQPDGTEGNWQIDERPEARPIKCADNVDRHHYLFVC